MEWQEWTLDLAHQERDKGKFPVVTIADKV